MPLQLETPALPLRTDADGVIRVGQTRVTLDTVVSAFNQGATAEQITHDYPVLDLADIYAVIHFYLRRRHQVDNYLVERRKIGEKLRGEMESRYHANGIRERLIARQHNRDNGNATSGG